MAFNADEVFTIAERIEEDAAEFYTKAANLHAAQEEVELLRRLARMENEHRDRLVEMRNDLTPAMSRYLDDFPHPKAMLYLTTIADAHGGEGSLSQAQPLTASDTLEDLLKKGIDFEQKTILFYTALKDMVPPDLGREQVDRIIEEEKQHFLDLTARLKNLQAQSRGS